MGGLLGRSIDVGRSYGCIIDVGRSFGRILDVGWTYSRCGVVLDVVGLSSWM